MTRDYVICELRYMADGQAVIASKAKRVAAAALRHIYQIEERVKLLESPARNVIRLAEDEGVDTHALLNAYLKRAERQTQELHRLQQRAQELEQQIEAQARRVE